MMEMKYSGAEWLGDIPCSWGITRIGSVYKQRSEKVSDNDYEPLSVTMSGIVPQLDSAAKSEDRDNRKRIAKGDFVINSRSDRRGSYGVSPYDGSCSVINTVLTPFDSEDAEYFNYVFQTKLFPDEFYRWGNGIVADLWSTKWESMRKIILPLPSKDERNRIAAFLNAECSKIDSLILKEQNIIEKLERYKQSIIAEKVTKGIRPNREMKTSGFPWIDTIPKEWDMVYSKKLFALRKEKAYEGDEQLTSSQKYGIISQKDFMEIEGRQVVQVVKGEEILKHVEAGDFVISMRSFQGGLEYSEISGKISSAYVMLYPRNEDVHRGYYKWLFKSSYYIRALQSTSNLVRDGQALRYSNFAQVYLPLFSIDEQKEIADYLDNVCGKIDFLTKKSETIIQRLTDYRKALVYEYVTGKKEVV